MSGAVIDERYDDRLGAALRALPVSHARGRGGGWHDDHVDARSHAPRRPPLLSTGLLCLAVSLLVTALGDGLAPPAVAWIGSAAWWLGFLCVGGHVLRIALGSAAAPTSSSSSSESSELYGERQAWGPPSQ